MWTLVRHLPRRSEFMRTVAREHGVEPDWTDTHSLLARVANEAAHSNFMYAQVNFRGHHKHPELITPPTAQEGTVVDVPSRRRVSSVDEIRQFFQGAAVYTPKGEG